MTDLIQLDICQTSFLSSLYAALCGLKKQEVLLYDRWLLCIPVQEAFAPSTDGKLCSILDSGHNPDVICVRRLPTARGLQNRQHSGNNNKIRTKFHPFGKRQDLHTIKQNSKGGKKNVRTYYYAKYNYP